MNILLRSIIIFTGTGLASCTQPVDTNEIALFESLDGLTVLIVSKNHYYIGPRDRPDGKDFLEEYGEKIDKISIDGGKCISLGIFKIVEINGKGVVCEHVVLEKKVTPGGNGTSIYTGVCFKLQGLKCDRSTSDGEPALTYSYKFEKSLGVTELYLAGIDSANPNNTLRLKSGKLKIS